MDGEFNVANFFSEETIGNGIIGYYQNNRFNSILNIFLQYVHDDFIREYTNAFSGINVVGLGFLILYLGSNKADLRKYFIGLVSAHGLAAVGVLINNFIEAKLYYDKIIKEIEQYGYKGPILTQIMEELSIPTEFINYPTKVKFEFNGFECIVENDFYLQRIIDQINRLKVEDEILDVNICSQLLQLAHDYANNKLNNIILEPLEAYDYLKCLCDLTVQIDDLLDLRTSRK